MAHCLEGKLSCLKLQGQMRRKTQGNKNHLWDYYLELLNSISNQYKSPKIDHKLQLKLQTLLLHQGCFKTLQKQHKAFQEEYLEISLGKRYLETWVMATQAVVYLERKKINHLYLLKRKNKVRKQPLLFLRCPFSEDQKKIKLLLKRENLYLVISLLFHLYLEVQQHLLSLNLKSKNNKTNLLLLLATILILNLFFYQSQATKIKVNHNSHRLSSLLNLPYLLEDFPSHLVDSRDHYLVTLNLRSKATLQCRLKRSSCFQTNQRVKQMKKKNQNKIQMLKIKK